MVMQLPGPAEQTSKRQDGTRVASRCNLFVSNQIVQPSAPGECACNRRPLPPLLSVIQEAEMAGLGLLGLLALPIPILLLLMWALGWLH
jgi:hypothetical protein